MIITQGLEQIVPPEAFVKLNKQAIQNIVRDIASAARTYWIQLAQKDKSSFADDYVRGIQAVKYNRNTAIITLLGEVPHLLEDGSPAVDMRTFLLGPDVPVVPRGERGKHQNKEGGYYRAIPFRHAIPSSGKVVGGAMGKAYRGHEAVRDAKKLGREIYRLAKKLDATTSNPYGKTKWGGRLQSRKARTYGIVIGQGPMVPLLKPHHTTDIYQGMVRSEKVYNKAKQAQYHTFRMISTTGGDPSSWIRKPIQARHYADKVNEYVQRVAPMSLRAFLEAES